MVWSGALTTSVQVTCTTCHPAASIAASRTRIALPCEPGAVMLEPVALACDSEAGPREVEPVAPDRALANRSRERALPEEPGQLHLEPRLQRPVSRPLRVEQPPDPRGARPPTPAELLRPMLQRRRRREPHPPRACSNAASSVSSSSSDAQSMSVRVRPRCTGSRPPRLRRPASRPPSGGARSRGRGGRSRTAPSRAARRSAHRDATTGRQWYVRRPHRGRPRGLRPSRRCRPVCVAPGTR